MTKKYKKYKDVLIDQLRDSPKEADIYLETAWEEYSEDGDMAALMLAIRNIAEAKGGIGVLEKETKLTRQALYKALSSKGNPRFETLDAILHSLGYRTTIEPI